MPAICTSSLLLHEDIKELHPSGLSVILCSADRNVTLAVGRPGWFREALCGNTATSTCLEDNIGLEVQVEAENTLDSCVADSLQQYIYIYIYISAVKNNALTQFIQLQV